MSPIPRLEVIKLAKKPPPSASSIYVEKYRRFIKPKENTKNPVPCRFVTSSFDLVNEIPKKALKNKAKGSTYRKNIDAEDSSRVIV